MCGEQRIVAQQFVGGAVGDDDTEGLAQTQERVSADLLADWIQHAHLEIHLSTVYRTLESLGGWGIITQVRRPHGAAFFHLLPTHQHVVCEVCGRIEDVPSSEFDELVDRLRSRHDFELDVHQTALVGRCSLHARSNGDATHHAAGRLTGSA